MADALSNALQKLSVARSGSHIRPDYQSVTPPEPSQSIPAEVEQPESPAAVCDAGSTVEAPCGLHASVTTEIPADRIESVQNDSVQNECTLAELASPAKLAGPGPMESVSLSAAPVEPLPVAQPVGLSATAAAETATVDTTTATVDTATVGTASVVTTASETQEAAPKSRLTEDRLPLWKRPLVAVLENRRNVAAVVVIICMAVFWFDDPGAANSTGESADSLAEDFSDVEAALSEFDVRSAPELKEPAEPIDVPAAFDLTIPTHDTVSNGNDAVSNQSEATATYPDSHGGVELPPSNRFGSTSGAETETQSSGFSAAPVSTPGGSRRSVKARLSHSIQPIH